MTDFTQLFFGQALRVQKVKYIQSEETEDLRAFLKEVVGPLVGKENSFLHRMEPVTEILCQIVGAKDQTWQHEDEIRLVFSSMATPDDETLGMPVGLQGDGTYIFPEHPLRRDRDGASVPYFSKNFGRLKSGSWNASGAISDVIIGPNNPMSVSDVTEILRSRGYRNFTVEKSRCSFRP